jgi:hypothetical protein
MRGKEHKLKNKTNYNIKLGTVDNNNPACFYFIIKGWAKPTNSDKDVNYKRVVQSLQREINQNLYNNLDSNLFDKQIKIVDLDLRESGITYGKKSYFKCEVTLYQKNTKPLDSLIPEIEKLTTRIVEDVLDTSPHFDFTRKK